jgi:hypothetical protein
MFKNPVLSQKYTAITFQIGMYRTILNTKKKMYCIFQWVGTVRYK